MKLSPWLALALAVSTSCFAAQQVTLKDGRKIRLNDDFTWQYVTAPANENAIPAHANPVVIPIAKQSTHSVITLGAKKPVMQLSRSGVDVLLNAAHYQDGELILPTAITNQGTQSVILVRLQVTLKDKTGQVLAEKHTEVWQSIKRMAETYLRPQTAKTGRAIHFSVPKDEQYQIVAKIIEVEAR